MTLKFQLNIDTSNITPAYLATIISDIGSDFMERIEEMTADNATPTIERHQCAPVFANGKAVGNWRIITS